MPPAAATTPERRPRDVARDTPVPAYLLGIVLIGLGLSVAGPALSHLRDRVGTTDGGIAWVFVGQSAGYILGSVGAGRGLDSGRGHVRWVVAMGVACTALVLVAIAPTLAVLIVAFALLGGACGLCDVSANTLVMWSRPEGPAPLLNALHLCFALGAMVTPVVVNRSIHYASSIWGVALPMVAIAAVCASFMLPHPSPQRTRHAVVERSRATGARSVHVGLVCAFFFAYVALETGFANWIHNYTEQIGYGGASTATGVTSMFGIGFAGGRLLAIWLSRVMTPGRIVLVSTGLSVLASLLFVLFDGPGPMLWVVSLLFALSVAPQYASMMAFSEQHLALSGRNMAAIVAASGAGGLIMPPVVGQLFDRVGPQALPPTVVVLAILTALVGALAGRMLLQAHRPPVMSMNVPIA